MSTTTSFDIKLDRVNKIYQEGETINGKLYFDSKTEIRHEGINLWFEGYVNLQTTSKNVGFLETFSNTVKPISIVHQMIDLPKVIKISAGETEIPFSVEVKAKPNKTLYETYHGVIMIQYLIKCEVRRSILNANLQRTAEVFIVNRKNDENNFESKPITFTITPNTLEDTNEDTSKLPDFKIIGSLDSLRCKLDEPFTGKLMIQNSNTPIRSIELQLTRIETCGLSDEQFMADSTTEVQRIQVADGNILRNSYIPLYMLFPRLFTCSTLVTREFKIEFELNLIITFEGNFLVKEMFPLQLVRN